MQRKLKNWARKYENDMTTVSISTRSSHVFFMNVDRRAQKLMPFHSKVDDIDTIPAKLFQVYFSGKSSLYLGKQLFTWYSSVNSAFSKNIFSF